MYEIIISGICMGTAKNCSSEGYWDTYYICDFNKQGEFFFKDKMSKKLLINSHSGYFETDIYEGMFKPVIGYMDKKDIVA